MSAAKRAGSERTIQLLLDWESPDGKRVDVSKAGKVMMSYTLHVRRVHA